MARITLDVMVLELWMPAHTEERALSRELLDGMAALGEE